MPNKNIEAYAERSGKSVEYVEKIWNETVEQAKKKFPEDEWENDHYWAWVNATVLIRLNLKTPKKRKESK